MGDFLEGSNLRLFLAINASDHPPAGLVALARLVADSPVLVAPLLLAGLWVRDARRRGALLAVAVAVLAGQALNQLAAQFCYEPRPFALGIGRSLLAHVADNSFPSDHATLAFALGCGLIATGAAPGWGAVACAMALATGWARVYLGVHFPADVIAAAPIGGLAGLLARLARPSLNRLVLPPLDAVYEVALRRLRLPQALFPRRR